MNNNEIMNNEVVEGRKDCCGYRLKRSCRRDRLQVCSKAGNRKYQSPDRAEKDDC